MSTFAGCGLSLPIQTIFHLLFGPEPLSGVCAETGFELDAPRSARSLNGAWMIRLCGPDHARWESAGVYLQEAASDPTWGPTARFCLETVDRIAAETESADPPLAEALAETARWAGRKPNGWDDEARQKIWSVLFPQGADCLNDPDRTVADLRKTRTVRIQKPNPNPLTDPAAQLLITSNVLLTLPDDPDPDRWPFSRELSDRIRPIFDEPQRYWFDHPIPLDIDEPANELLYGLRGLDEAIAFEKERGTVGPQDLVSVVLSVSVTHERLSDLAVEALRQMLAGAEPPKHLKVYVFTETMTHRLLEAVLEPAARRWCGASEQDLQALREVFGVDGPYGRHYSFLKSVAALWHVLIDRRIEATFKIDLDQVFDQPRLVAETGLSALEHFLTPLWGAEALDAENRPVEMGMIAGALVNEKDIGRGLFSPDVTRPQQIPAGEATVFFNRLPMALSTEAEMMCRYGHVGAPDGRTEALHRIHVTGGTNGIRIDALRRHRPFTPGFIGRAEDQAYLLSVLFNPPRPLRYLHASGLIMRHDKEAFAAGAMAAAKTGRFIGDLARTLYFSAYRDALDWPADRIQAQIDPFTGCFASKLPVTLVAARLALHTAAACEAGCDGEAEELLRLGAEQLGPLVQKLQDPDHLPNRIAHERRGWDLFHQVVDGLESALNEDDSEATAFRKTAHQICRSAQILGR